MNPTVTHPDLFQSLKNLVTACENDYSDRTKEQMELLYQYCREGMDMDSQKMLGTLFLNAIKKRHSPEAAAEHIYLKEYEVPQIQLFNILIDRFPFVKISQQIANQAIIEAMKPFNEVTLVDIGIGQGTQVLNILARHREFSHLEKLVVVGIEPYTDALLQAEERINALKKDLPFELEFIFVNGFAEEVNFNTIPGITKNLIVNASLALHHIQSQQQRSEIIQKIKQMNPAAFILIEPNVDHFEPVLSRRFENCYHHFYSIFRVIDRIEASQQEKNALKIFFGREIDDIIGKREDDRFEKHEPALGWIKKLRQNNFTIRQNLLPATVDCDSGVRIARHNDGFIGFTYDKETVLSIIYAN